jgi:hypothetical protein
MFKSLVFATSLATVAMLGSTAEAKTNVRVYLGVPFYGYQVGPGWAYYDGYGWYDPRRHGDVRVKFRNQRPDNKMSCKQARRLVQNAGYRNVSARECGGRTYTFVGQRNGKRVLVYVNSRSGGIWRG